MRCLSWYSGWGLVLLAALPAGSQSQDLSLVYPPPQHQTTAEQIFFIGSAPPNLPVWINGQLLQRSEAGHFAPVLPLRLGTNEFVIRHPHQEIKRVITRHLPGPLLPVTLGFAPHSWWPRQMIARLPQELICFTAIAPPQSRVKVHLGDLSFPLTPQATQGYLPPNATLLNGQNQPRPSVNQTYSACRRFDEPKNWGIPRFIWQRGSEKVEQESSGALTILDPQKSQVIAVTANPGVTRTGPSTDHSRLTPLPQGSQATVNGQEGEWLRLDYGVWIHRSETQTLQGQIPPHSQIRSVAYGVDEGVTTLRFPLQVPVPISVRQTPRQLTLILHQVTAQTDTIRLDNDPIIESFHWQQISPQQVHYTFRFKSDQQWGYDLHYQGSTLILSLRHPPPWVPQRAPLQGIKILLDPGHGGSESGALGPTGYPEKAINLVIAKGLAQRLQALGATVYLTRTEDEDVSLVERVRQINTLQPAIALSIHYNALPDGGDPNKNQGISTFWYHPQAEALAQYLQGDLTQRLQRPTAGVYWNNLALTRPSIAPAVLLELGFMINPLEFEWIGDRQSQEKLIEALADSLKAWLQNKLGSQSRTLGHFY